MDLLLVLWSFRGEVVSKEQLIQQVWQGAFMTDHVVTHAIWQLRRALSDPRLVQSIPKRGYRLALEAADPNRDPSEHSASLAISERRSSVVVLPFANLSGDPELEYFTDGMTDAVTSRLAQFSYLRVISRTSSLHYRNRAKPIHKIASELDVDTVVEGTVLRDRSRVRISGGELRVRGAHLPLTFVSGAVALDAETLHV